MTIARQLGLDPSTVSNFFMNARRRSVDKWKDENESPNNNGNDDGGNDDVNSYDEDELLEDEGGVAEAEFLQQPQQPQQATQLVTTNGQTITLASAGGRPAAVLVAASPAAVVQHLQQADLNAAAALDL